MTKNSYCRHCGVREKERSLVDCPDCGETLCTRCISSHPCDYYQHIYLHGGSEEDWDREHGVGEYDPEGELDMLFPDGIDDGTDLSEMFDPD